MIIAIIAIKCFLCIAVMHYHIRIICDFNDAYIVAKGKISVRGTNDANKINKNLTFKNSGSFR